MVYRVRVPRLSHLGRFAPVLLVLCGCRSGYELLDQAALDATNEDGLGGAPNSGGDGSDGGSSAGGTASGGEASTGGRSPTPSGDSGGQASGGAIGMGGDPGSGGALGMGGALGSGGEAGIPTTCTTVVADSVADFSSVQGQGGWTYGYFVSPSVTPDDFLPMTQFGPIENLAEDGWFVSGDYWTAISASKAHPNGASTTPPKLSVEHHAVRRFTSTEAGSFFVQGSIYSYDGSFNGTRAYILVEGVKVWEFIVPTGQTEAAPLQTVISVGAGDRIDFVLDPYQGADQSDSTEFVVQICL